MVPVGRPDGTRFAVSVGAHTGTSQKTLPEGIATTADVDLFIHTRERMLTTSYLLSYLQALGWCYRHHHWTAKGDPSYGDHLLYERLYDDVSGIIDGLAEKIQGSVTEVDVLEQARTMADIVNAFPRSGNASKDMLIAELGFQKLIRKVYETLKADSTLSLGMDDFLMSMASEHETNIYLLRQRTRKASSSVLTPEFRRNIEGHFHARVPDATLEFKGKVLEVRIPGKSGRDIERVLESGPRPMTEVLSEILDTSEYVPVDWNAQGDVYVITFDVYDSEEDGPL